MGAGDVEDVTLELALFDGLVAGVDAEPVPVADPVGGGLGLGVPAGLGLGALVLKGVDVVCV